MPTDRILPVRSTSEKADKAKFGKTHRPFQGWFVSVLIVQVWIRRFCCSYMGSEYFVSLLPRRFIERG